MTTTAERAIPKAYAKLRKEGALFTVRRPAAVAAQAGATLDLDWQTTTGYAIYLTSAAGRRIDGEPRERSVAAGERILMMAAQGVAFRPQNGDQIFRGTIPPEQPMRVKRCEALEPSGAPVFYTLTVGG